MQYRNVSWPRIRFVLKLDVQAGYSWTSYLLIPWALGGRRALCRSCLVLVGHLGKFVQLLTTVPGSDRRQCAHHRQQGLRRSCACPVVGPYMAEIMEQEKVDCLLRPCLGLGLDLDLA